MKTDKKKKKTFGFSEIFHLSQGRYSVVNFPQEVVLSNDGENVPAAYEKCTKLNTNEAHDETSGYGSQNLCS